MSRVNHFLNLSRLLHQSPFTCGNIVHLKLLPYNQQGRMMFVLRKSVLRKKFLKQWTLKGS